MKSKLAALIIGIGLVLYPSIGKTQGTRPMGYTLDGEPVFAPTPTGAERKAAAERARQLQDERDAAEKAAEDARHEQAYKEDKAKARAKANRLRKAAGEKPFHSWQLNH
jgi:hypothetical protein